MWEHGMYNIPTITALSLAALLSVIGAVQLAGPRVVHDLYRRWDYPQGARLVTGFLDIAAAAMIASPSVRGWGIALAGVLIFGSGVTLLNHGQYVYAAAVIVMMASLVPATLAVPRSNQVRFITTETQLEPLRDSTQRMTEYSWYAYDSVDGSPPAA